MKKSNGLSFQKAHRRFLKKSLMADFEEGMTSVDLCTQKQNTASVNLLRKLGFEIDHDWEYALKQLSNGEWT